MPNGVVEYKLVALGVGPTEESESESVLEPREGMEFESEEAAKTFYNSYARRVGFSTRVSSSRRSRRDGAIIQRHFVCAREGFRVDKHEPRHKRPRAETRTGCKATMVVKAQPQSLSGSWVVCSFVREHNHDPVPPDQVHSLRSHRHVSGAAKSLIDTLQGAGIGPGEIMSALVTEFGSLSNVGFTERDCRNYMGSSRERTLGGDTRVLVDCFESQTARDPGFAFSVQGDPSRLSNVFWVDSRAKRSYGFFGDAVTLDTSYRAGRYRLPFASFTGVNHHGQPALFGCALLVNESEESFVWLFRTWLEGVCSGDGRPPVSITTARDRAIRLALARVLPNTRHRFCNWHVFKECQEMLSRILTDHPGFEPDLHRCVNLSESTAEFESGWLALTAKYGLSEHDWVRSLYDDRWHWVPVYVRDTFFAELSTTQRSDGINSYFDGYINAATTLQLLVRQYERAIENRHDKEIKADYDTINAPPGLRTPSPMEKQAAGIYTRKLFAKFQEELVETLTFSVTKVGETEYRLTRYADTHQRDYSVRFDHKDMMASCSCQMYEFSGILCRHILAVFRVTNVLTLPSRYVLKRWTRHAKTSFDLLEDRASQTPKAPREDSFEVRYDYLCHEALKYVDGGIETVEIYDAAIAALREAAMKIELVKSGARLSIANGPGEESIIVFNHYQQNSRSMSTYDQDKKIEELKEELSRARQKQEAYRTNLNLVMKDIEEKKLRLLAKVQSVGLELDD